MSGWEDGLVPRESYGAWLADVVDDLTTAVFEVDDDWRFTDGALVVAGLSTSESLADLVHRDLWETFPSLTDTDFERALRRSMRDECPVGIVVGTDWNHWYEVWTTPGDTGLTVFVQDVTEVRESHRQRQVIGEELAQLTLLNRVTREVNRAVVESRTRQEVARAACDALTGAGQYALAVLAERTSSPTGMDLLAVSGFDAEYLDALERESPDDIRHGPASAAMLDGEPVLVDLESDDRMPPEVRGELLEAGITAAFVLPLRYSGTTIGVLIVYHYAADVFSPRVRSVLAELSDTIADAMNAADTRELLFSGGLIEVTLAFDEEPEQAFAIRAAKDFGLRLVCDRVIPIDPHSSRQYFTVYDGPAGDVLRLVAESEMVTDGRILGPGNDGGERIELTVTGRTSVHEVFAFGGRLVGGQIAPDGSRLEIQLPASADVRGLVEAIRSHYPSTELVSKRAVSRETGDGWEAGYSEYLATLTDRQRTALELACQQGYFEWPREQTAEELAEMMGVSAATFHQHLRAAERKTLTRLVSDGTGVEEDLSDLASR